MPFRFTCLLLAFTTPLPAQLLVGPRPADPGAAEIKWASRTGNTYGLWASTDLVTFTPWATGLEATQPLNTMWVDRAGFPDRFFIVGTDPPPAGPPNLVSNGDFSSGFDDWNRFVSSVNGAVALVDESGGEMVGGITNGGTAIWHVQLLHPDIPLVNGETHTLSFDARSVGGSRTIRVRVQTENGVTPSIIYLDVPSQAITTTMQTYSYNFTMTDPTDLNARINISMGGSNNDVVIDNVSLTIGTPVVERAAAHAVNQRLAGGNNFAAFMATPGWGAPEDYALLNSTNFSHCRIGYKMDEEAGATAPFTIPASHLDELQSLVDFCLAEGLIAVVDPVHNWAATGFDPATDFPKLQSIWQQVATRLAGYPTSEVVFEIMNEPRNGDNVTSIISTGLAAIRGVAGNAERIVIVSGDGFSTRQALIDAMNSGEIPANDNFLIGTFHYYDPFTFTRQGDTAPPQIPWGTATEFNTVGTAFDAVVNTNNNFANSNGTEPLPIYLGEFGVDNAAPAADRKAWLAWVRMQAELRGFAWCHWLMYNDLPTSKGLGPWTNATRTNPSLRSFQPDAVEALHTRYEAEDGSFTGAVTAAAGTPGFTGTGYASFPTTTVAGDYAEINGYCPRDDSYNLTVRYASELPRTLTLTTLNDLGVAVQTQSVAFPATGSATNWATLKVPVTLEAGEDARFRFLSDGGEGPALDYVRLSK